MPQEEEQTDEIQISDRRKFDTKKNAKDTLSKDAVVSFYKYPLTMLYCTFVAQH